MGKGGEGRGRREARRAPLHECTNARSCWLRCRARCQRPLSRSAAAAQHSARGSEPLRHTSVQQHTAGSSIIRAEGLVMCDQLVTTQLLATRAARRGLPAHVLGPVGSGGAAKPRREVTADPAARTAESAKDCETLHCNYTTLKSEAQEAECSVQRATLVLFEQPAACGSRAFLAPAAPFARCCSASLLFCTVFGGECRQTRPSPIPE